MNAYEKLDKDDLLLLLVQRDQHIEALFDRDEAREELAKERAKHTDTRRRLAAAEEARDRLRRRVKDAAVNVIDGVVLPEPDDPRWKLDYRKPPAWLPAKNGEESLLVYQLGDLYVWQGRNSFAVYILVGRRVVLPSFPEHEPTTDARLLPRHRQGLDRAARPRSDRGRRAMSGYGAFWCSRCKVAHDGECHDWVPGPISGLARHHTCRRCGKVSEPIATDPKLTPALPAAPPGGQCTGAPKQVVTGLLTFIPISFTLSPGPRPGQHDWAPMAMVGSPSQDYRCRNCLDAFRWHPKVLPFVTNPTPPTAGCPGAKPAVPKIGQILRFETCDPSANPPVWEPDPLPGGGYLVTAVDAVARHIDYMRVGTSTIGRLSLDLWESDNTISGGKHTVSILLRLVPSP